MEEHVKTVVEIIRQCTRQPIGDDVLTPEVELRNDLGIDSLGMLMLFERIGSEFNIDPVQLSNCAAKIRSFGDLLAQVAAAGQQTESTQY